MINLTFFFKCIKILEFLEFDQLTDKKPRVN